MVCQQRCHHPHRSLRCPRDLLYLRPLSHCQRFHGYHMRLTERGNDYENFMRGWVSKRLKKNAACLLLLLLQVQLGLGRRGRGEHLLHEL